MGGITQRVAIEGIHVTSTKVMLLLLISFGIIAVGLLVGACRWKARTRDLRARLESARIPDQTKVFTAAELANLPAPVQRYFRAVLDDGQAMVSAATLRQTGTFNMQEGEAKWLPFTSTQRVIIRRPGFDWDARIKMFPGVFVQVHDAYIAGEGVLHAAVYGLFSIADQHGTRDLAEGELLRFFAEAPWYPTALLPSQHVQWTGEDATSARATLTDGDTTVTMLFHFDGEGLIDSMLADSRSRSKGVSLPWQGRFWNYALRDGMKVPLEAEVSWVFPEGPKPYCRIKLTKLDYEFAN